MTQWEYFTAYDAMPEWGYFGANGWELVTIISRPGLTERAVFKRPIGAPAAVKASAKKGTK